MFETYIVDSSPRLINGAKDIGRLSPTFGLIAVRESRWMADLGIPGLGRSFNLATVDLLVRPVGAI